MQRRDSLKGATRLGLWAAAPLCLPFNLVFAGATSTATTAASGATPETAPMDVASLMRLVRSATEQHNFTGTYVVTAGGTMSSSRITHVCEGRNQFERIEALDGPARQVYRHNDTVHVLWPAAKEATIEQRRTFRRFPLQATAAELSGLTMYEALEVGSDRVAGQDTAVVAFRPKDSQRFAQRWWVDKKTGMLLRVDTFGQRGELVESAAYSDIQFSAHAAPQALMQDMNRLQGYHVVHPHSDTTDLDREGWSLRALVAGFQAVSSVRRERMRALVPASSFGSASGADAQADASVNTVIQTIYSDGLTHVSLFIEPLAMHPTRNERVMSSGATQMVTRRLGDWWITAVGDVPTETLAQFVAVLERRKPGS